MKYPFFRKRPISVEIPKRTDEPVEIQPPIVEEDIKYELEEEQPKDDEPEIVPKERIYRVKIKSK